MSLPIDQEILIIQTKLIKPRMEELGFTAYTLAKKTRISESTLSKWFAGKQEISLVKFLLILGALDINPYFFTKESDHKI